MESSTKRKLLGIVLLISGLFIALRFSGTTSGFHAVDMDAILKGIAYIGGFVIAFIGAGLLVYKDKKQRET